MILYLKNNYLELIANYINKYQVDSIVMKELLKKINNFEWELPKTGGMNVPAKIFASEKLLNDIEENAIKQISNVAALKGIQKKALAMPDMHSGYGFPIGGVAAFDLDEGIISPGGVGYDINCGVRLLVTNLPIQEFLEKRMQFLDEVFKNVPAGLGSKGRIKVTKDILMEVLSKGTKWAVKEGYGVKEDIKRTEENGCMPKADPHAVSERAMQRGMPQLGSLGSGNHFLEVQQVSKIFDEETANVFGLDENNVTLMIHCGSRGLGHQVASDYIKSMESKFGFKDLPDRELINAPINSDLGQKYYAAMSAAVNYAFANRQMIMHWVRESFINVFGGIKLNLVYDVAHNIAKFEKHKIDGSSKEVCVHRKGATRSCGPDRDETPEVYKKVGQPVLIPGSMGTASYVLVGTNKAEEVSFCSTAHGAGRVMSRHAALKQFRGEKVKATLSTQNIEVKSSGWKGLAEEAPGVYKDIDEVVRVSHEVGIGNLVARVVPLAVIKG